MTPRGRIIPIGLILLSILAHLPSVAGGFVWDDRALIVESPATRTLFPLSRFFRADFWGEGGAPRQSGYYRPLTLLSYAATRAAFGDGPLPFHLTNIGLHAIATLLAYAFVRGLRAPETVAALTAALFAVHPVHAESVAWISGRTDLLAACFALGALVLSARLPSAWIYPAMALLYLLSLLSKESAVFMPLVVAASPLFGDVRRRVRAVAAFGAGGACYLYLRLVWAHIPPAPIDGGWLQRAGDAGKLFCHYAGKMLWPTALPIDFRVVCAPSHAPWFAVLLVVGLVAPAILAARGSLIGAGLLVFALGLLPTLGLYPIADPSALRFLYLPSLGFLLVLVATVRAAASGRASVVIILLLVPALMYRSMGRSLEFTTDERLFRAELSADPDNGRMAVNLADTLRRQGRLGEAVVSLQALHDRHTATPEADRELVRALGDLGEPTRAAEVGRAALERWPDRADLHSEMALVMVAQGFGSLAREELLLAVSLDPDAITPRVNLATLLARTGRAEEALEVLDEGLARRPESRQLSLAKERILAHLSGQAPDDPAGPGRARPPAEGPP